MGFIFTAKKVVLASLESRDLKTLQQLGKTQDTTQENFVWQSLFPFLSLSLANNLLDGAGFFGQVTLGCSIFVICMPICHVYVAQYRK